MPGDAVEAPWNKLIAGLITAVILGLAGWVWDAQSKITAIETSVAITATRIEDLAEDVEAAESANAQLQRELPLVRQQLEFATSQLSELQGDVKELLMEARKTRK